MKHRLSTSHRSNTHRLVRPRDGIIVLPDLGSVYVQVRGMGGGLGKAVESLRPISIEGLEFAFDPDAGIGFSITTLEAIHVEAPHATSYFEGSLAFEFRGFPHGLGIHLLPGGENRRRWQIADLLATVPTESLADGELEQWRGERRSTVPMCPCCRDRAKERSRHPESHPLHSILQHAAAGGITLHWRFSDAHADLSAAFVPARIEAREGFLIVSDAPAHHAAHLEMARLHALAIQTKTLDGFDYARIQLFEPRGRTTFEILAEDPDLAPLWQRFCERPAN